MTDNIQAINYIKQYIKTLESDRNRIDKEIEAIKVKKETIVLERSELTASKSAFLKKVDGHGAEVKRTEKLHSLATKMKQQIDEDRDETRLEMKELDKRRVEVIDLEAKQTELEERETVMSEKESSIEERELLVEKEKAANRSKQEYLELQAKGIKKKQIKLQRMLDAQKV